MEKRLFVLVLILLTAAVSMAQLGPAELPSFRVRIVEANGTFISALSRRQFQKGERIRLSVQSSLQGYLYVVAAEPSGQRTLVFPRNDLVNQVAPNTPAAVFPQDGWLRFDDQEQSTVLEVYVSRIPVPTYEAARATGTLQVGRAFRTESAPGVEVFALDQIRGVVSSIEGDAVSVAAANLDNFPSDGVIGAGILLHPINSSSTVVDDITIPCSTVEPVRPRIRMTSAGRRDLFWKPGSRITVGFLDGDTGTNQAVATAASEWTKYANVTLDFDVRPNPRSGAQVRVTYQNVGNWSLVGTECLGKTGPTMSLQELAPGYPVPQKS